MKKVPQRTCIVCAEKKNKKELNRIVKNKEGNIFFDSTGKANGRGAYICSNEKCIEALLKGNVLNRTFKLEVSEEIKNQIKSDIQNDKK